MKWGPNLAVESSRRFVSMTVALLGQPLLLCHLVQWIRTYFWVRVPLYLAGSGSMAEIMGDIFTGSFGKILLLWHLLGRRKLVLGTIILWGNFANLCSINCLFVLHQ